MQISFTAYPNELLAQISKSKNGVFFTRKSVENESIHVMTSTIRASDDLEGADNQSITRDEETAA